MKKIIIVGWTLAATICLLSNGGCSKAASEADELLPVAKRVGRELVDEFKPIKRDYDNLKMRHQCQGCGGLKSVPCIFCGGQGGTVQVVMGPFGPQQAPVPCGRCNGSGRIVCGACGGLGWH